MSGKPPPASGAPPRLLLYVAEPPPPCRRPPHDTHRPDNYYCEPKEDYPEHAVHTEQYLRYPTDGLQVSLRNGQNQLVETIVNDQEKRYVNYQFLEQSVTQSVNQSISILNSGNSVSENDSAPQLVRTADGVVLAVLPPSVPGPSESEFSSRTVSECPQTITVPLGWRRIVSGPSVIYLSPSGTALSTLPQLQDYLQTTGTCKCGLPCPLRPETAFSFDPKVVSKPYQAPTGSELAKLCNHKRKLLATLSARAQSPATPPPQHREKKGCGVEATKKKMKKRPFPNTVVHRDRAPTDYKVQDMDNSRTVSPGVSTQRAKAQPNYQYPQQSMPAIMQPDLDKPDTLHQRGNHYLTVNSGWIHHERVEQKHTQPHTNGQMNVGLPVLGTNGQIIGVNTGYKHQNTFKNQPNSIQLNDDVKEEKKEFHQAMRKEEESQIFCGLNQPLTPEVMQKINEQQQLFIQQNQKQIEMAMKGYRTNLETSQKQGQSQFVPQAQLVIQNGAVVKTNPAKTPPWQVKRSDCNPISSPSPKSQKSDNMDSEDSTNLSEESTNSNNSFQNEMMTQNMCSRVPPLPQHYNLMGQQWPGVELNKKKPKTSKTAKKKASPVENKNMMFGSNGMRVLQEKGKSCNDVPYNNIPSFMDDPSGYLAQQTVLLNNTISRQVNSYDNSQFEASFQHIDKAKQMMKPCDAQNLYLHNPVSNPGQSPSSTPDSSLSDKNFDSQMQCCKGCNVNPRPEVYNENQMRLTYMKQNMFGKMEPDRNSPKHQFGDNPVTSSTFDRNLLNDNCHPIQAATVSTSNVSPTETSPPEPSPTPSNSSRNADTPLSNHSGSGGNFPNPSPAYNNNNPCFNNPPYSSPGPPTGTQVMHFISNHNVNKNLMEVDNISMVGFKKQELNRRRLENAMPGYCAPPHLGGGPSVQTYVQSYCSTVAGFSVNRDTVTSVLAGRAHTATTSINASQAFVRPPPPAAASYAIPNNHPDPFLHSVTLPTSYPLHIAGTTAQNMISKSPLEIVQNVISPPSKTDSTTSTTLTQFGRRPCRTATPGQILISSTGQIMVSNSTMPPPPPKTTCQLSNNAANVTTSVSQVVPAIGQTVVNQPAVVVNTLPTPFVIQPNMMTLDGPVVQQTQIVENARQIDVKGGQGFAMLSPERAKRSKKKKSQSVTNVLQINAPQNNIVVHSSPQHTSPQFSPRGFQLSPNNISGAPLLQALTILPGKSGAPAHIVMNGQASNNFTSQQLIANTSPSQQINLLQPVNLINNGGGAFPAYQQFIVPSLGGMVMTADGTAIIQDNGTGVPMQLQLQTVNGQNVLTPVQNQNVFTGTNGGMVIRTQNQQGKMIQSQHSPGAQFLSPNSQVMMNSPNFNGQLSPLLANLSPPNVTFNTSPQQVRSGNVQTQEYIQTNQMGQTLMVPLSPKQSIASTRSNSTFLQQNTTIVQQQTTLVSNSHNASITTNIQSGNASRLSIDPNVLLNHKIIKRPNFELLEPTEDKDDKPVLFADTENPEYKFMNEFNPLFNHVRHSVSTQTLARQQMSKSPNSQTTGCSPPDTTTHSPLGVESSPVGAGASPAGAPAAARGQYADTTTGEPEPGDNSSQAMVQCVSSSEPDVAESRDHAGWPPAANNDFSSDSDTGLMSNIHLMRQTRLPQTAESTDMHYPQTINQPVNQGLLPMTPRYYERSAPYKRKNEFGDGSSYRNDKIMRTTYNMAHGPHKDAEYENGDKTPKRHFVNSGGTSNEVHKVYDRHNLGNNPPDVTDNTNAESEPENSREFHVGDLVWGPVKGYVSWPGKLVERAGGTKWTVRWFGGDKAQGAAEDSKLLTLSEGLEAHHAARTKHRKSRKLNTLLENAIQEAMAELDKKSEPEPAPELPTSETTKRKKPKEKKKGNPVKTAPSSSKMGDGARLRSSR